MPMNRQQVDVALEIVEKETVNAEQAAAIFGVGEKFFYRLVAADKFGLRGLIIANSLFREMRFYAEEIKQIAQIYRGQRKAQHVSEL